MLNWEFVYAQINGGSDQGSQLVDGKNEITSIGAPPMKPDHQFNKAIYKQYYKQADYDEAKNWRAELSYNISNEEELATLVLSGTGAADVAVNVGNNFMSFDRYGCPGASAGAGNHAVGVQDVELVDGRLFFDMFNSWDLDFGPDNDGHCYLEWNRHFVNTIRYHGFYATLSTDTKVISDTAPVVRE